MPAIQIYREEGREEGNEVRWLRRISGFLYNKEETLNNTSTLIVFSVGPRKSEGHIRSYESDCLCILFL
jgi:hypothetical protein